MRRNKQGDKRPALIKWEVLSIQKVLRYWYFSPSAFSCCFASLIYFHLKLSRMLLYFK